MQTQLADFVRGTAQGREAESILRSCVHCGFCTATCPTYQLLGDELDGPRGRIYLIKQLLEGRPVTRTTQLHLDRCLTCLSCETTCPSGVRYGRLVDIGRELTDARVSRPWGERLLRRALRSLVPYERRFGTLLGIGRAVRGLLPGALRALVPAAREGDRGWPDARHTRRMLVLRGCVQPAMAPQINAAAARVLDRLGIRLVEAGGAGCCGAVDQHLAAPERALRLARRNVDAWHARLQDGAEALVMTASGCGAMVRQYGELLAGEPGYREKAAAVVAATRDLSEVLAAEDLTPLMAAGAGERPLVACHTPCTLQHAQHLPGAVSAVLQRLGLRLARTHDDHLCCGSAGTYSILQATLSERLRENKLRALTLEQPACIVTANIGCLHHLQSGTDVPVLHWIELVDRYCTR